ncbi:hypothetical protein D3C87_1545130 [compost metagenome]
MRLKQFVAEAADPDDGRHAFQAARVDQAPQLVGQMRAVAVAHDDVADHQIVELAAQCADGFRAAAHAGNAPVSQRQQHVLQVSAFNGVIFDQKNPPRGAGVCFGHCVPS